jgi:hypothetical protein
VRRAGEQVVNSSDEKRTADIREILKFGEIIATGSASIASNFARVA